MPAVNLAEAAKIGFNESVDVGGRALHVQTEVLTRGGGAIRTTILDGGIAKFVKKEALPTDLPGLEALATLVKAQHDRYVGHIKKTGALWQDSI
jgi:hypothetical protein